MLVGPWVTLLAGQDLADVVVPYGRSWGARLAKWDEVRAFGASVVVLLPNSLEAAVAAWYWKAPRRIGFDAGGRGRLLTDAIPMPASRQAPDRAVPPLIEGLASPSPIAFTLVPRPQTQQSVGRSSASGTRVSRTVPRGPWASIWARPTVPRSGPSSESLSSPASLSPRRVSGAAWRARRRAAAVGSRRRRGARVWLGATVPSSCRHCSRSSARSSAATRGSHILRRRSAPRSWRCSVPRILGSARRGARRARPGGARA